MRENTRSGTIMVEDMNVSSVVRLVDVAIYIAFPFSCLTIDNKVVQLRDRVTQSSSLLPSNSQGTPRRDHTSSTTRQRHRTSYKSTTSDELEYMCEPLVPRSTLTSWSISRKNAQIELAHSQRGVAVTKYGTMIPGQLRCLHLYVIWEADSRVSFVCRHTTVF